MKNKVVSVKNKVRGLICLMCLTTLFTGCGKKDEEVKEPVAVETQVEDERQTAAEYVETLLSMNLPDIGDYKGTSVIDALEQSGHDSSYEYRGLLAEKVGIVDYKGTYEQNLKLLEALRVYHEFMDSYKQALDSQHDYTDWRCYDETKEWRLCRDSACTEHEYREHSYGAPVVTYKQYSHYTKETTTQTCATCGFEYTTSRNINLDHVYDQPTQITNSTNTRTPQHTEHNYSNWNCYDETKEWRMCRDNSCSNIEYRNHSYGNAVISYEDYPHYTKEISSQTCSTCGYVLVSTRNIIKENTNTQSSTTNTQTNTNSNNNNNNNNNNSSVVKPHEHNYVYKSVTYSPNSGETHDVHVVAECTECGTVLESHQDEPCNYTEWIYNDDSMLFESSCEQCGRVIVYTNTPSGHTRH